MKTSELEEKWARSYKVIMTLWECRVLAGTREHPGPGRRR